MGFPLPDKAGSGNGPQQKGSIISRVDPLPIFNEILLPNGLQGSQGLIGSQGKPGAAGNTGESGINGPQGMQGWQGNQGFQAEGAQGFDGFDGYAGSAGNQGSQGFQLTGSPNGADQSGSQGTQGATNGPQGAQGSQSVSYIGSQGAQGIVGSQGLQGSQGEVVLGFVGRPGKYGAQGAQGAQGTGSSGLQGPQGTQATAPGTYGVQGIQGSTGFQGFKNVIGIQGWQGDQGLFISPYDSPYIEDFDGGAINPLLATSGTITLVTTTFFGIAKITTATTVNSEAYVAIGQPQYSTEGVTNLCTFTVYISIYGTTMSGQKIIVGLVGDTASPETLGDIFTISTLNSGKWTCSNINLSGTTTELTTTDPTFSDGTTFTYQKLEIIRSSSDIKYYIDDVLEATISTSMPTQNLTPIIYITNVSSGARSVFCDYLQLKVTR